MTSKRTAAAAAGVAPPAWGGASTRSHSRSSHPTAGPATTSSSSRSRPARSEGRRVSRGTLSIAALPSAKVMAAFDVDEDEQVGDEQGDQERAHSRRGAAPSSTRASAGFASSHVNPSAPQSKLDATTMVRQEIEQSKAMDARIGHNTRDDSSSSSISITVNAENQVRSAEPPRRSQRSSLSGSLNADQRQEVSHQKSTGRHDRNGYSGDPRNSSHVRSTRGDRGDPEAQKDHRYSRRDYDQSYDERAYDSRNEREDRQIYGEHASYYYSRQEERRDRRSGASYRDDEQFDPSSRHHHGSYSREQTQHHNGPNAPAKGSRNREGDHDAQGFRRSTRQSEQKSQLSPDEDRHEAHVKGPAPSPRSSRGMLGGHSSAKGPSDARILVDRSSEEVKEDLMIPPSAHASQGADDSSMDMRSSSTTRVDSEHGTVHEVDPSVETPQAWPLRKSNYHLRSMNSSEDAKTVAIESDSPTRDPRESRKQHTLKLENSRNIKQPRIGTGENIKYPQFAHDSCDSVDPPPARAICCWGFGKATPPQDLLDIFKAFGEIDNARDFPIYPLTDEIMEVCWIPFKGEDGHEHARKAFASAQKRRLRLSGHVLQVALDGEKTTMRQIRSDLIKDREEKRRRKAQEQERALNNVQVAAGDEKVHPISDSPLRAPPRDTLIILHEMRVDDRKYGLIPKSKTGSWSPEQIRNAFASKRIEVARIDQDKTAWYIAFSDKKTAQRAVHVQDDLFDPDTNTRLPCEIHDAPTEEEIKIVEGVDDGRQLRKEEIQDAAAGAASPGDPEDTGLSVRVTWSERQLEEKLAARAAEEMDENAKQAIIRNRFFLKGAPALFGSKAVEQVINPPSPSSPSLPQSTSSPGAANVEEEEPHLPSFERACLLPSDPARVEEETRSARCESSDTASESLSSVPDISSSPNSATSSEDSLERLHTNEDGDVAVLDSNDIGEDDTISSLTAADPLKDSVPDHKKSHAIKLNEYKKAAREGIASAGRTGYRNEVTSPEWQRSTDNIGQDGPQRSLKQLKLVDDDEDYYFLKIALEKVRKDELIEEDASDWGSDESDGEEAPRKGSARTEAVAKIPARQKALHVADRNQAVVDTSMAAALSSARDNRADSRRLVANLEQHKKDAAAETDILKFNQLRTRKKQLKFAKSPIHDWGLYAMELIPKGDMVIEYVGEVIRQQIADEREKKNELNGNFSTYLFRVDDDVVVDATRKGNIARLMNHSCTPNCNAKILTVNGEKRIVLFAKDTIFPGQELTYDYKFQAHADDDDAIPCLCGSPGCRKFL